MLLSAGIARLSTSFYRLLPLSNISDTTLVAQSSLYAQIMLRLCGW